MSTTKILLDSNVEMVSSLSSKDWQSEVNAKERLVAQSVLMGTLTTNKEGETNSQERDNLLTQESRLSAKRLRTNTYACYRGTVYNYIHRYEALRACRRRLFSFG